LDGFIDWKYETVICYLMVRECDLATFDSHRMSSFSIFIWQNVFGNDYFKIREWNDFVSNIAK